MWVIFSTNATLNPGLSHVPLRVVNVAECLATHIAVEAVT